MNKQLKRLGAGLMGCYLALFAMVNYIQVIDQKSLQNNPRNFRTIQRNFDQPRGQIITADGVVVAKSVAAAPGDSFTTQRVYPEGDLFASVTGYLNLDEATGVERQYNDQLLGATGEQQFQELGDLLGGGTKHPGDVHLTIRKDVQQTAKDALANVPGHPEGAVVAIDPRNGELLALWSNPSFDPNALASHDEATIQKAKGFLNATSANTALRADSYQQRFFPGSTFKVVTGSVGVQNGLVTDDQPVYPNATSFPIDFTKNGLSNFDGENCGGNLVEILRVSCNSSFAAMGVDTIGQQKMVQGAESFGFNDKPPLDLPGTATSVFPTVFPANVGNGTLARASIGQGDTSATPLEMALVCAAAAGNGQIFGPHVMKSITDSNLQTVKTYQPTVWKTPMSPQAADQMKPPMLAVVERGTGRAAQIPGVTVGGKSGTAQLGTNPPASHALFMAWAIPPGGQQATVAVMVFLKAQPGNADDAQGGRQAAPVAKAVLQKILAVQADPRPTALSAPAAGQ